MTRISIHLLAGLAALGLSGIAQAADMGGPYRAPTVIEPIAEVSSSNGWYLRGDVGVGFTQRGTWSETIIDNPGAFAPAGWYERRIGNVGTISAGVGYQFSDYLRGDLTIQYRTRATIDGINYITQTNRADTVNVIKGHVDSVVALANGYIDMGHYNGLTPYIGAGIGAAYNRTSSITDTGVGAGNLGGSGSYGGAGNGSLAWALHTGLSYAIASNLRLDAGYSYLNLGKARTTNVVCGAPCAPGHLEFKDLASHDFHLGLRYLLSPADPKPVYAAPVVAKF